MSRYPIYFLFVLTSCVSNESDKPIKSPIEIIETASRLDTTKFDSAENTPSREVEFSYLKYESFEIEFQGFLYYERDSEPIKKADTITLEAQIGNSIDNSRIYIKGDSSDTFTVYCAFQQTLTVYLGERQSKDLEDWSEIDKEIKLKQIEPNTFQVPEFKYETRKKALQAELGNLKKSILNLEGEYINEDLDTVKSIDFLPIEVWPSLTYLRIERTNELGEKLTKYIIVQGSWGC